MAQTKAQLIDGKGAVDLGALSISGSAPDNSVNLDASGRFLVGTSSTSVGCRQVLEGSSGGLQPGIQILAANTSAPADNSALGAIYFADNTHGSGVGIAADIFCRRDGGTWSASSKPTRLVFGTTADGASSSTERMRIDNLGYATGSIGSLGRGLYESYQFYSLNSGLAGSNVNTAQNILGVGVTLVANTIYEFEGIFVLTKTAGTTSHSFGLGFGGTATLNNIQIQSIVSSSANALPTNGSGFLGASTSAATFNCITGIAVATVSIFVRLKGIVSTSGAGTFIPQYTLSVAPGGAYTTNAGSHFKIAPLAASGANVSIGTWA